jgi:predicted membrane protein DUF2207
MQVTQDAPATLYSQAWMCLGIVLAYYIAIVSVLRLRRRSTTVVIRYDPPPEISPAVASHLWECGHYERAFASALVSLAAKGYLELGQNKDRFVFKKLLEPDAELAREEYEALIHLFLPSEHKYTFDSLEFEGLSEAYAACKEALEETVEPNLISTNKHFWWVGMLLSVIAIVPLAGTLVALENRVSWASVAYSGIWILLGGSCLVASVRVWPPTLHKLSSYIPWDDRPSRPFNPSDAFPLVLSAGAFLGFLFLSVLTTTRFGVLVAAVVFLNAVFRHRLDSPTRVGREILAELRNFREFLSSADAPRLNRENQAGVTPRTLEKYSAYAVALRVEYAWGEELVENLVEFIELNQAYARR